MYLFVGQYKKRSVTKLILGQHSLKFFPGFSNTLAIIGIDNKNHSLDFEIIVTSSYTNSSNYYLCALKVMSPQRSDFALTANIPYGE